MFSKAKSGEADEQEREISLSEIIGLPDFDVGPVIANVRMKADQVGRGEDQAHGQGMGLHV